MSLLGSSQMASPDGEKADSAAESARVLVEAVRKNLKPRDIITRKSIENAVAVVMAIGGSTNAVLHYLAIASSAGPVAGNLQLSLNESPGLSARSASAART
jgi:dihydroxy-acid dehydratase